MGRLVVIVAILALGACSGSEGADSESAHGASSSTGEAPPDAGDGCRPGESLQEDGACLAAGVPPDGCGQGFVHDGDAGCDPVLPAAPCPAGTMAIPGETECHEVGTCAEGTWGGIPVEPGIQYVDASYMGGGSSGSQAQPWTTIQDAIDAAPDNGIVAVAEGTYDENPTIWNKPVRVWGRCPALVHVTGQGASVVAFVVFEGASGSEIHGISVTGQGGTLSGIGSSGSQDVLVEDVWIRDADTGVYVEDGLGPTSITVRNVLVEEAGGTGMFFYGVKATVESSLVRKGVVTARAPGHGVEVLRSDERNQPADVTLRGVVLEESRQAGVLVEGSIVTMEASVVRTTLPDVDGTSGRGVNVEAFGGAPSEATLRTSVIEGSGDVGVFVAGGHATFDAMVVRDGKGQTADPTEGGGIQAQYDEELQGPTAIEIRRSLIARNLAYGCQVIGADLLIEQTVVRDTRSEQSSGTHGEGIHVQSAEQHHSVATIRSSRVERSQMAGMMIDGTATIEGTLVEDTQPQAGDGHFGDGIIVISAIVSTDATISTCRVARNARAGVVVFGASVSIGSTTLECNAFDLDSELLDTPSTFDDRGDNTCGCGGETVACAILSSNLEPPAPVTVP